MDRGRVGGWRHRHEGAEGATIARMPRLPVQPKNGGNQQPADEQHRQQLPGAEQAQGAQPQGACTQASGKALGPADAGAPIDQGRLGDSKRRAEWRARRTTMEGRTVHVVTVMEKSEDFGKVPGGGLGLGMPGDPVASAVCKSLQPLRPRSGLIQRARAAGLRSGCRQQAIRVAAKVSSQ